MNDRNASRGEALGDVYPATTVVAATDESIADLAEVALLTKDGADFRRIWVDAVAGVVTLRGKVGTESEKREAAALVRRVDGVDEVNNQLEVAPEPAARAARR